MYSSNNINSSRSVYSSRNVELSSNIIFCNNIRLKKFYAFNKQATEERFYEIKNFWNEIKGDFKLELKDNEWEAEWERLPNDVWQKLSTLPEFDKEVVEKIIGFEINLKDNGVGKVGRQKTICNRCGKEAVCDMVCGECV